MSDYNYLLVSDGTGDAPLMHITANRSVGATTLSVDSVTHVPANFIATAGTLLASGFIDPSTKTDFKGHVSGTSLIIDAFEPGSSDAGNTSGQVVVIKPNTGWANRIAQFIKNATNQGTPEAHTVSTLTATDVETTTMKATGTAEFDGAVKIAGTSYFQPQSTTTVDGSGNITPAAQVYRVTALAANATIQTPSYTPQDGMSGELRISDDGTGRTLTWAAGWKAVGVTLPTATTGYAFTYIGYEYSQSDSKWHVLSVARG